MMIRDSNDPERGIHAQVIDGKVNVVVQYGSRHRGSVYLSVDDLVGLIAVLARHAVTARGQQLRADELQELEAQKAS